MVTLGRVCLNTCSLRSKALPNCMLCKTRKWMALVRLLSVVVNAYSPKKAVARLPELDGFFSGRGLLTFFAGGVNKCVLCCNLSRGLKILQRPFAANEIV